jgi:hypothetical protein
MGMMKNYLLELLHLCSDQQFGQDAVEWAIVNGHLQLTYDLQHDLRMIMGEPGNPDNGAYSTLIIAYQLHVQHNCELLVESYQPVLEELNRTIPLAT